MVDPIVHVEIPVSDLERAKEFYSKVFGWKITETLGFTLFETGGPPGGSFARVEGDKPRGCLLYIAVEDIESRLADVERAGGRVLRGRREVPGVGWDALFEDVSGNAHYLFTPLPKGGQ
jgi:hypothetical protein